jgi:predicted Zn-dependent peptidase
MKTTNLKAFWDSWYQPENAIVVVAGGISKLEELAKSVEQKFDAISDKKHLGARHGYQQVFTQTSPRVRLVNKKSEQAHLVMGVRSLPAIAPEIESLSVLATVLGGNMSSRLWDEVREKRGLAYYIRCAADARIDNGSFTVRAGVRLKDAEEAVKVITGELLKVADKGITSEELSMGKEAVKGNFMLDLEDSMEVAEYLSDHWATTAGKIESPKETLAKVDEVTAESIKQVAREVLKGDQLNLSIVGPFKNEEKFLKALS